MLLRKNTKAFKTILEIIRACRDRPDREALIRLYITRAGDTVKERISVEGIQGEAALFYEMGYQAVLGNLMSSNHQLHHSDELPGLYFFHSSSNKVWDETPFEFDEAVKKEFASLPELPADPVARCEALGGVPMLRPPTVGAEGQRSPPELAQCYRDVHATEDDVRRARRAWHERNKASERRLSSSISTPPA